MPPADETKPPRAFPDQNDDVALGAGRGRPAFLVRQIFSRRSEKSGKKARSGIRSRKDAEENKSFAPLREISLKAYFSPESR
jgi:hypothetical protein